ncbi:MAG: hypothetical protein AB7L09_26840 [Nitrospira sp.]
MRRSQADLEAECEKLRNELSLARMALIGIASPEFQDLFHGIFSCKRREEAYEWQRFATEKIIERVKPRPASEMGDVPHNGPRAYCPMCGGSSGNIYQIQGFAHPEGLRRHLEGSFNARQCVAMKAALAIAIEATEDEARRTLTVGLREAPRKRGAPRRKR